MAFFISRAVLLNPGQEGQGLLLSANREIGSGSIGLQGSTLAKVPAEFWGRAAIGPKLRELQFLLYEPKPLWGDIVPLETQGRLELVRLTATLFYLLHSKGLVVGDVSMNNLLWSQTPVGIFLLDCDSFRIQGKCPVSVHVHTPDWNDPLQLKSGPDQDADRYKLALLVARVLTRNHDLRPGDPLEFIPGLPERIVREVTARFTDASRARGARPCAGQWLMALSDRGTFDLPPLPPVRKGPDDMKRAPLTSPASVR